MAAKPIAPIIKEVAERYGYTVDHLLKDVRTWRVTRVRHYAMWLARAQTGRPFTEIARAFCRDHSTIIYAYDRIERMQPEERGNIPAPQQKRSQPAQKYEGMPCKYGHTLRYVSNDGCVTCNIERKKQRYWAERVAAE